MRNLYWIGEIDEMFCEKGLSQINEYEHQKTTIHLSSKGGKSDLALILHDAIARDRSRFTILAGGLVASCGVTLMCACPKDQRFSYKNTRFMVHDLYISIKGSLASVRSELRNAERMQKVLDGIYQAEFDYDNLVAEAHAGVDVWFDAETAREVGLVKSLV